MFVVEHDVGASSVENIQAFGDRVSKQCAFIQAFGNLRGKAPQQGEFVV